MESDVAETQDGSPPATDLRTSPAHAALPERLAAGRRTPSGGRCDKRCGPGDEVAGHFGGREAAGAMASQADGLILLGGTAGDVGAFGLARIVGTVEKPQTLAVGGDLGMLSQLFERGKRPGGY